MTQSVGLGYGSAPLGEAGLEEVTIHPGDRVDADQLGARVLALTVQGAPAEVLDVHLRHHPKRAPVPFRLPLRQ